MCQSSTHTCNKIMLTRPKFEPKFIYHNKKRKSPKKLSTSRRSCQHFPKVAQNMSKIVTVHIFQHHRAHFAIDFTQATKTLLNFWLHDRTFLHLCLHHVNINNKSILRATFEEETNILCGQQLFSRGLL